VKKYKDMSEEELDLEIVEREQEKIKQDRIQKKIDILEEMDEEIKTKHKKKPSVILKAISSIGKRIPAPNKYSQDERNRWPEA